MFINLDSPVHSWLEVSGRTFLGACLVGAG